MADVISTFHAAFQTHQAYNIIITIYCKLTFFCITADNIEPPGSGGSGSGSGSGSGGGGGNGLFGASCVQAGFATCCVGTEAECTVGPSPIECSCSRDCYFSQSTTCCHDITEVPCFPGTCRCSSI